MLTDDSLVTGKLIDRFEKKPSGGWRTNGKAMVGVNVKAVPGGSAKRPSSVIQTKRFLRECGCFESLSINSSWSNSSVNELTCVFVWAPFSAASVTGMSFLQVACAINTVKVIKNKTIFEVFSKHSHVKLMIDLLLQIKAFSCYESL